MIRNNQLNAKFANTQAKCHASKGEAPSPCDHPTSCHMHFGGYPLTPEDTTHNKH